MQVGDLSVCGEYKKRLDLCILFKAFAHISFIALLFFLFFYWSTDKSLKRLFLTFSHLSHSLTNRPAVIKGILSYVSKQSMKDQHQKKLLLTLTEPELPDNAVELER